VHFLLVQMTHRDKMDTRITEVRKWSKVQSNDCRRNHQKRQSSSGSVETLTWSTQRRSFSVLSALFTRIQRAAHDGALGAEKPTSRPSSTLPRKANSVLPKSGPQAIDKNLGGRYNKSETTRFPCPYLHADVELTAERERHIAERHPDLLPEHRQRLADTLAAPDQVRRSTPYANSRLFSRWFESVRHGKT
jgi:hypothetical protein